MIRRMCLPQTAAREAALALLLFPLLLLLEAEPRVVAPASGGDLEDTLSCRCCYCCFDCCGWRLSYCYPCYRWCCSCSCYHCWSYYYSNESCAHYSCHFAFYSAALQAFGRWREVFCVPPRFFLLCEGAAAVLKCPCCLTAGKVKQKSIASGSPQLGSTGTGSSTARIPLVVQVGGEQARAFVLAEVRVGGQ